CRQLARAHRAVPFQHRERGELRAAEPGQAACDPLGPQPPGEAGSPLSGARRQARVGPGLLHGHID
ncbi:MAG: hypothetical protein ACRDNT_23400, partial [Streptosporangiaceae bacterium]